MEQMKVKDIFETDSMLTGRTEIEGTQVIGFGGVPVGCVLPWLKSMTGTPAMPDGWVECNGQTLSDVNSDYNGQVIPNLNGGNRFLRGNSTSGGTGGSATHNHDSPFWVDTTNNRIWFEANPFGTASGRTAVGYANLTPTSQSYYPAKSGGANNLPPYMDVVWIMRVR